MFKFAYLLGDLIFLLIWAFLFWRRRDLRSEMWAMSILTAVMGPISEYWYFRDYWQPLLLWRFHPLIGGLEDVLFGFAVGGIAAVLYEEFLGLRLKRHGRRRNWILLAFALIEGACMIVFCDTLGINSIFASCIGFLLTTLMILMLQPNLLKNIILSGLFLAGVMFTVYFFFLPLWLNRLDHVWLLYNSPWGILLFNRVPLTEMVWAICWGMVGGPLYEFWQGYRLKGKT